MGKAKATNKLEQHLIASESSPHYSNNEMCMHQNMHSVCHLPRNFRMSPGRGHSPLAAPLACLLVCGVFHVVVLVLLLPSVDLPAATAPGFWLSSEERFGSILGCLLALSVAFFSLLDIARICLETGVLEVEIPGRIARWKWEDGTGHHRVWLGVLALAVEQNEDKSMPPMS